jgi:hypothetical protein
MIFDAIETQRLLVEESASKTKKARREAERTKRALSSTSLASNWQESTLPSAKDGDSTPLPLLPYDVEEW